MRQVVITGISSGIGYELARLFASHGHFKVTGTSRNVAAIPEERRIEGCSYLQLDLRDRKSIESFAETIEQVDILIHNAGISSIGAAEDLDEDSIEELFRTNTMSVLYLTALLLPRLRQSPSGRILFVSSLAYRIPVPFSSLYAATKAALNAYCTALRQEVRSRGVQATCVFFDFVRTGLPQRPVSRMAEIYRPYVEKGKMMRDSSIEQGMDPRFVAERIMHTALKPRMPHPVAIGRRTKALCLLQDLLPHSWFEKLIFRRYMSL